MYKLKKIVSFDWSFFLKVAMVRFTFICQYGKNFLLNKTEQQISVLYLCILDISLFPSRSKSPVIILLNRM